MRGPVVALLAILLSGTGGCTHITANTSQFYLAQDYLPLPPSKLVPVDDHAQPDAAAVDGCAGAVVTRRRKLAKRYTAQVLPGMQLHVVQTSYAASRNDQAEPLIADWRWTVPGDTVATPSDACADDAGAVPGWGRADLLRVRSLLSGAQITREAPPAARSPIYFEEAMTAPCVDKPEPVVGFGCREKGFLDRFVAGLEFNLRAQSKLEAGDAHPQPQPDDPFESNVPANVIASDHAPGDVDRGYGKWYAGLSGFRFPADLFGGGAQADKCRGPFTDGPNPGDPALPQNAMVCKFAQTSLDWDSMDGDLTLPGPTLSSVTRLTLLRSGDPLLLFQPQSYFDPLDLGNTERCNGDTTCKLANRTMQGFTDIELLIPVMLESGERRWVPVGMSVAAYEIANGVHVTRLSRSAAWLPQWLSFEDGKKRETRKLGGSRGRVDLLFYSATQKSDLGGGGVAVRDAKDDMLFAPGDIITARRP